jgi:hypothetical protein
MRTERAWRTGRDRLFSIVGIRDTTRVCIERAGAAPPGTSSVPGVVRWPTKALKSVLVLWKMREVNGEEEEEEEEDRC